jgi:esterase/lipase superfamily enzyme
MHGDVSRLGAIDPEQAPYKKELEENKIMVIDLTKIKSGDSMNHGKFAESPEIVQLIGQRICRREHRRPCRFQTRSAVS